MSIRLFFSITLILLSLLLLSGTVLHTLLSFWFGEYIQATVSALTSGILIVLYSFIASYCIES